MSSCIWVVDGLWEKEWEVLSSIKVTAMQFSVRHDGLRDMDV